MKILVTGATGFVGGALTRKLIENGHCVKALVRKRSYTEKLKQLGVELIEGDVRDKKSVEKAVADAGRVFHIAALFRQARFKDEVYWDVNVSGTKNVLKASYSAGVEKFIHCSTVGVLSHIEHPPADESFPYSPGDIYQKTKAEGEKLALKFCKEENFDVAVVRPAMIYGPGDIRLLKLFKSIAKKRFIMIGSGETLAHFVYIDDLIDGFLLAADSDKSMGEVFIIASEGPITLNNLVGMIAEELGVTLPKMHLPVKPFQVLGTICETVCKPFAIEPPIYRRRVDFFTKDRAFNIAKAEKVLGYRWKVGMREGIKRTIAWYRIMGYL